MKRLLAGMLIIGSLFLSLAAAASGVTLLSCRYPWDHDSDVRQWSDNEWVWAGIHGQVEVCDGQFQRVLKDTVNGITEWKGVTVDKSSTLVKVWDDKAVAQVHYLTPENGYARAMIPNYYG